MGGDGARLQREPGLDVRGGELEEGLAAHFAALAEALEASVGHGRGQKRLEDRVVLTVQERVDRLETPVLGGRTAGAEARRSGVGVGVGAGLQGRDVRLGRSVGGAAM